ncbi:MAG TPA: PQQ-dependent sugar dehydrogenase [Vicinamibacterales bacterium]|nr:PQQ-dependent sugar dehydrogenase [Vicinamibacterales bacterium]
MTRPTSSVLRAAALTAACATFLMLTGRGLGARQRGAAPPAPGRAGGRGVLQLGGVPLGDGPWEFSSGPIKYRVSVVTKGLDHPWGIAFLPNGDMLVTERNLAQLRVIRNGTLDPAPISGIPKDIWANPGQLGGLLDVVLHPQFAQNHVIYFAYSKQSPDPAQCPDHVRTCLATLAVARARWDGGSSLSDVKDIIVTKGWAGGPGGDKGSEGPASGSFGSRLAFDRQGYLYITSGDRNIPATAQDPQSDNGKILRLRDDGRVPPDNPFVNDKRYLPEIYSLGHRNPLGLYFHPVTGELWESEEGPQGGDEVNVIKAGKNYGWPLASLGRNYDGTVVGQGYTAPGIENPVVFWVPAIAISGLSIYDGDRFPQWKGNVFVGAMRANTGHFIARVSFNAKGLPTGSDHSMLADLRQRIREVRPGPDGDLYVLTDETAGAVLRIEPAQ